MVAVVVRSRGGGQCVGSTEKPKIFLSYIKALFSNVDR